MEKKTKKPDFVPPLSAASANKTLVAIFGLSIFFLFFFPDSDTGEFCRSGCEFLKGVTFLFGHLSKVDDGKQSLQ